MYKTPFNKRSANPSRKNSRTYQSKQQHRSLNSFQQSMVLHSNGKNIDQNQNNRMQSSLKQETNSVLKQLAASYFYSMCQSFQQAYFFQMQLLNKKILMLQYKIAHMQKAFNSIQINLHRKSKEISTIIQQNKTLINLNNDIESRIQQLRQKYQIAHYNQKTEWFDKIINEFRGEMQQFQARNKQCQSCQKGIKQKIRKQISKLEQLQYSNIDRKSAQVISATLKQVVKVLYCSNENNQDVAVSGWKQKILENIDLKFQIIYLQQSNKQISSKTQTQTKKEKDKIQA